MQIVENKREGAAVRQSVIANLGRADQLAASGALASLIASGAKLTDQVLLISALDQDAEGALSVAAKRIGGPLLFGRIWERLGIGAVFDDLLKERAFEFPVERAAFVATLHRLFVSGSDRDCAAWTADYDIPGAEGLDLHHFYRAMAWLGEEMEEKPAEALAPRCVKDLIEERLFERRRDLFTDLSAVFMDTTSLSFYGEGGETLGEHGYSKDYRPDLKQMILGLVVDGDGRPICTEMWPGNTADVTTLLPVVDRLRQRFSIGRVGVVADRGMISAETIAGLEERKLEYSTTPPRISKVTPLPGGSALSRSSCKSRTPSAEPRRSCARGRSSIPPTRRSAATSSARSWRFRCKSNSTISCAKPASPPSGATSCAISTVSPKCAFAIAAPIGWCAPTPRPR